MLTAILTTTPTVEDDLRLCNDFRNRLSAQSTYFSFGVAVAFSASLVLERLDPEAPVVGCIRLADLEVHPWYRNEGLGDRLLDVLSQLASTMNRTLLVDTRVPEGTVMPLFLQDLLERRGFHARPYRHGEYYL